MLLLCPVIFNTVSTHKSLTSLEKFFQRTVNVMLAVKNGPILSHIFHILILFWSYNQKNNIQ